VGVPWLCSHSHPSRVRTAATARCLCLRHLSSHVCWWLRGDRPPQLKGWAPLASLYAVSSASKPQQSWAVSSADVEFDFALARSDAKRNAEHEWVFAACTLDAHPTLRYHCPLPILCSPSLPLVLLC
jgi:hypothetical protein